MSEYWKEVAQDSGWHKSGGYNHYTQTYEHQLPHGVLVRTVTRCSDGGVAVAVAFVPAAPVSDGVYR